MAAPAARNIKIPLKLKYDLTRVTNDTLEFMWENSDITMFVIDLINETHIEVITEEGNKVYTCMPSQIVIKIGPRIGPEDFSDLNITCAKPNFSFSGNLREAFKLKFKLAQIVMRKDRLQMIARARNLAHAEQAGIIDPRARRVADGLVNQATQPALHKALENPYGWQQTVASFLAAPENQVTDAFKFKKNGTQNAVGLGPVLKTMKKKAEDSPFAPSKYRLGGRRKNKTRKNSK